MYCRARHPCFGRRHFTLDGRRQRHGCVMCLDLAGSDSARRMPDSTRRQIMWKNFVVRGPISPLRERQVQDFPRVAPPGRGPPRPKPLPLTLASPSCAVFQNGHYGLCRIASDASIPRNVPEFFKLHQGLPGNGAGLWKRCAACQGRDQAGTKAFSFCACCGRRNIRCFVDSHRTAGLLPGQT